MNRLSNPGAFALYCPGCRDFVQQWMTDLVRTPRVDKPPPWVWDDATESRVCKICKSITRNITIMEAETELNEMETATEKGK